MDDIAAKVREALSPLVLCREAIHREV